MLSLLVSVALVPITYGLGPGVKASYQVEVTFDGFIPLLGGQTGQVAVNMGVDVNGLAPDAEKRPQANSELKTFEVVFNGAKLPFGVGNAIEYFPKTTVSLTPQGKVVKTDAPDLDLPFRLPGLHVKRFPDITYLPLEFPADGVEVGKEFTFKKAFGDSDVSYTVTPTSVTETEVLMDVKMSQTYEVFEDSGLAVVKNEKDAEYKAATVLTGVGKVVFDRKRNLVGSVDITADATSTVTNLKSKEKSERKLKTQLKVKLQK